MRIEFQQRCIPLGWFGNFLAAVRFNSVSPSATGDSLYLRKRRFRHANLMVPLANRYAGGTGMKMRVLTCSAWLRHEPLMYRLLLGCRVRAAKNTLLLPRLPGRSLLYWLERNGRLTSESKLAVSLAVVELARLHNCLTPHPWHGELQLFSHADATIENVLIDIEGKRARWIDFETTHEPSLSAVVRHADDLLTLLCGAAAAIEPGELPELCKMVLCSYESRPVTNAMLNLIQSWAKRPAARQLAIPLLKHYQWRILCQAVGATAGPLGLGEERACDSATAVDKVG
jgi:hypothetical protein